MTNKPLGQRDLAGFVGLAAILFVASLRAQAPGPSYGSPTQPDSPPPDAVAQMAADDYLIGPDDVLRVFILDVPELSGEYRVSNTGTVTLPVLATPVTAAGLTLAQFSDSLKKELKAAGLVSDPHVSTSVDTSRLHSVAITGAVKRPQLYPIFTQTTLLDMISQAEGLADDAGGTAVVSKGAIAMRAGDRRSEKTSTGESAGAGQTVTVDVKRLVETGDPKLNLEIYPGDRITVPHAGIVYVVGAVNKPGGFPMKPSAHGMSALEALALAEDTKTTALRDETVIIRNDSNSPTGRRQIPVPLKKVLRGKNPDPILQADDILFIPDSAGKRALRRGFEAAVQATTGVAIYSSRF